MGSRRAVYLCRRAPLACEKSALPYCTTVLSVVLRVQSPYMRSTIFLQKLNSSPLSDDVRKRSGHLRSHREPVSAAPRAAAQVLPKAASSPSDNSARQPSKRSPGSSSKLTASLLQAACFSVRATLPSWPRDESRSTSTSPSGPTWGRKPAKLSRASPAGWERSALTRSFLAGIRRRWGELTALEMYL